MASITLTTIANGETTDATIAMANWNAIKNVVEALVIADITDITATAAEVNIMDGVTSTTAELNILDGVTSTAAELNYVDITTLGTQQASKALTSNASNVATLGGTLNVTGILQLAGTSVTSTAAELNKVDGYTGTAANLNTLVGGGETTLHSHASSPSTDKLVGVDSAATADYLGASSSTGVLRTDSSISKTDGGDYVTLSVVQSAINTDNITEGTTNKFASAGSVDSTDLNTTTGSLSGTLSVTAIRANVTMHDYTFFPSIYTSNIDATSLESHFAGTSNTIGGFTILLDTGVASSATYDIDWRYVTASDKNHWVYYLVEEGLVKAVWEADDHCPSNKPFGEIRETQKVYVIDVDDIIDELKQRSLKEKRNISDILLKEYKLGNAKQFISREILEHDRWNEKKGDLVRTYKDGSTVKKCCLEQLPYNMEFRSVVKKNEEDIKQENSIKEEIVRKEELILDAKLKVKAEPFEKLRTENEAYRTKLFEDGKNFELKMLKYQEKLDREYKQKKIEVENEYGLKLIDIEEKLTKQAKDREDFLLKQIKDNESVQKRLIEDGVKQELIGRLNIEKSIILNSIDQLEKKIKDKK